MDEQYLRGYRELYERHWWWRTRDTLLTREVARIAARHPVRRILDVGCGDGLFFPVLSRFGEVYGVEPVADALDPHGAFRSRIHAGPFDASYCPDAPFDLVLALDVIEHLRAPHDFLAEVRRMVAPGGWFIATVPAFRTIWTAHDDLNEHVTRFTRDELTSLISAHQFEIVDARYFFVLLAVAKFGVRGLEALLRSKPSPPGVPAGPVNAVLTALCRAEQSVLGERHPWFGSSLLVVARALP